MRMVTANEASKIPSKEESERTERALIRAEAPILSELRSAGYDIPSLWEHDGKKPPDRAIDVLVEHLQRNHPFQIRWAITNIISGDYATKYFSLFVKLFANDPDVTGYKAKSGVGGLIGQYCDDSNSQIAVDLAKDPRHGESRVALLDALFRRRIPAALNAIGELVKDPSVRSIAQKYQKRITEAKLKKRPLARAKQKK